MDPLPQLVEKFSRMYPELCTPEGAREKCRWASARFCDLALEHGIRAEVDEVIVINGVAHKAVILDTQVIDWTARQYIPHSPWPLIYHINDEWPG